MKKLLLSLGLLLGLTASAFAQQNTQCVGVGGINNVPVPGIACAMEPTIATYTATVVGLAPASSATDILCLTAGSSTKVIRLQEVRVSGTAGTAVALPISITYHTSPDTGGTAGTGLAAPVPTGVDPSNSAATAITSSYTANPTLVTTTTSAYIDAANLIIPTTSTLTGAAPYTLFDWKSRNFEQAPILRTANQQFCLNLNSVSVSTGVLNIKLGWTEAAQ